MASPATPPPAYAWDWVGRQRLVWVEARRRLATAAAPAPPGTGPARPTDVPDWSDLLARDDGGSPHRAGNRPDPAVPDRAWADLATRAEVVAALRAAYPHDPAVRTALDGTLVDVAFLGRRGGALADLGIRTPPRGLRWWWVHLGGEDVPGPTGTGSAPAPGVQLTLADVMTGYGDPVTTG
jgi:hypothetical protein